MRNATKAPTIGSRIEDALGNELATEAELIQRTGLDREHIHTHLRTIESLYKAAQCERTGGDWVWRLTPASDTRTKRCLERTPEGPGYRNGSTAGKPKRTSRLAREANEIAARLRARSHHED